MKILLVKTSSLGDIIQTFPVLDYLRRRFPLGQIDWVVETGCAELVRANPQVNRVLTIDSKTWRKHFFSRETRKQFSTFRRALTDTKYDLLFDLQGNLKSGGVVFFAHARKKIGFGWKTTAEWPNALFTSCKINPSGGKNIREDYLEIVKKYFNDTSTNTFEPVSLKLDAIEQQKLTDLFLSHAGQKPTLVCPSSAWPNKCLSETNLIQMLTRLNRGPYWFIWGNVSERQLALKLSAYFPSSTVLERLSLPLLQHVMAQCQLVVTMDSLPLHLCATTATPTLSFFGPSLAAKYAPLGKQHLTIQGSCPYGMQFEKRCPKLRTCPTGSCLKNADIVESMNK